MLWMWVAIPISYPVVTRLFMPFYHKLNVYTAYEYLERRFSLGYGLSFLVGYNPKERLEWTWKKIMAH